MDNNHPGSKTLWAQPLLPGREDRRHLELPFDWLRFLDALVSRWRWVLASGVGMFLIGLLWGCWTSGYVATAKLIRNHPPAFATGSANDSIASPVVSLQTLGQLLQSPELLSRVAARSKIPVATLHLAVRPVPNTEMVALTVRDSRAARAAELANSLAEEAVRRSLELQAGEVAELNESLKDRLQVADAELERLNQELIRLQRAEGLLDPDKETTARLQERADLENQAERLKVQLDTAKQQIQSLLAEIHKQSPALVAAKEALEQARLSLTELHPKVIQLRAAVASIEASLAAKGDQIGPEATASVSSGESGLYAQLVALRSQKIALEHQLEGINARELRLKEDLQALPEQQWKYARLKIQLDSAKKRREMLADRQQQAQFLVDNASGYFRILQKARREDLSWLQPLKGGLAWGLEAALLAILGASLFVVGVEIADRRIRSKTDLKRISRLPVLATLGDLAEMTVAEQEQWAFRTLARLKAQLNSNNREALVCGFTSSAHGEGRSTWIKLLASAAERQGYRVLTIAAGTPEPHPISCEPQREDSAVGESQALSVPFEISRAVGAPLTKPVLYLPTDWIWNPQQREQWQEALQQWKAMDQLVVLIELPPASEAEAVLLAEHLPQLIWLCGKDLAKAPDTSAQIETLRHARSNLVGGVFNRATLPSWRRRFGSSVASACLFLALLGLRVQGQETIPNDPKIDPQLPVLAEVSPAPKLGPPPTIAPVISTSTNPIPATSVAPSNRVASWQQHLTLGPGDVFDIMLYDRPETLRLNQFIGPDGRFNYLQVQEVEAAGLTIDELREKLEKLLSKYYLGPRVVITPRAYNSKKYYLLGNVVQKGVFPLDRPVSIIEAVARARGFEATVQLRNSLITADLSRSFLVRKGPDGTFERMAVDLEGLFYRGDFSQNLYLAPEDYLYFPPQDLQEVYVLGEVRSQGVLPFVPDLTALGAIASRGGFTEKAYRSKILVVRGSLSHPETFVVNGSDVLAARTGDFPLKPRDLVYVSRKPWAYVQEILQLAVNQYAYAVVYAWTPFNVGPFTKSPFVPSIK